VVGPAGSGKSETCKDFSRLAGRFCLVFNCQSQVTWFLMQRLFMGVAQTGVFACLDEFNKLEPEVLSVVAQQFMTLRVSLLQKKEDC
jgi:dynein heavy chain, axonemal